MAKTKTSTKTRGARASAKTASRKPKASASKPVAVHKPHKACVAEVTIDRRRGPRRESEQGAKLPESTIPPVRLERRQKVNRRRQIDPTTCERDYTDDEIEFMNALDEYKRTSGRMFPTCSEVLEVVRSLGYVKLSASELAAHNTIQASPRVPAFIADEQGGEFSTNDWQ